MPQNPQLPAVINGAYPTSSVSALVAAVASLKRPPIADLKQTVAQSIPSGVLTALTLNLEVIDTDIDGVGGHDNVTNNSRWTCRYPGVHLLGGGYGAAASSAGSRVVQYLVNGIPVDACDVVSFSNSASIAARVCARAKLVTLGINDYVEIAGFQDSGGALNTSVVGSDRSNLTIVKVSD